MTKQMISYRFGKQVRLLALAALFLAPFWAWGQTDYSGVYYIASGGKAAGNLSGYTYNSSNPANNFYLCPTEGWCFYQATNDFTGTDNGQPFFTTYKCRTNDYHSGDPSDAIWTIEKASNSNYYYIKQTSTGKYMLSNGIIRTSTNADRIRVHLESVTGDLDDKALFAIEPVSGQSYVVIRIVSPDGINGDHKWLSVCYGNYDNLVGNSGKNGGPTGYVDVAGTVCIYTQDDANAPFYLEPATIDPPTITNNYDGTITITAEEGATIYYTTNGSTPTMETTTSGTTPVTVTLTDDIQVIQAIQVVAAVVCFTNGRSAIGFPGSSWMLLFFTIRILHFLCTLPGFFHALELLEIIQILLTDSHSFKFIGKLNLFLLRIS